MNFLFLPGCVSAGTVCSGIGQTSNCCVSGTRCFTFSGAYSGYCVKGKIDKNNIMRQLDFYLKLHVTAV